MAAELTFKQKMFKSLYGIGLKNFGPSILAESKAGDDEWITFAQLLLEGGDYPTRKLVVQQLTKKGFADKHRQRARLFDLMMAYLAKGLSDERRAILKFVDSNLALFPAEDDRFRERIMALSREKDSQISSLALALLPKIGINMDDRDMFRRA